MSGVVMKSNEEDEAGLLAIAECDDEDEADDGDGEYTYDLGGRRGRLRSKRNVLLGSKSSSKSTRVGIVGSAGQLMHTLLLCGVFFGLGFTRSLLDKNIVALSFPNENEMANGGGFVVGFIIAAFLLGRFSRLFILLQALLILGLALAFVPWVTSLWAGDLVHTTIGVGLAVITAAGNVICLDYWGQRSGPYLQALHFCLSLGLLTGPFIVDPLSQTPLPKVVQDYAHRMLTDDNVSTTTEAAFATIKAENVDIHRVKRDLDPLLAAIFDVDKPKPKPSFTDGRKLDYSQDWEKIKASDLSAKVSPTTTTELTSKAENLLRGPSIEDLLGAATKKSKSMQIIDFEIEQLHKDIERSEKLLQSLQIRDTRPRKKRMAAPLRQRTPPIALPMDYGDYGPPSSRYRYPSYDYELERERQVLKNAPDKVIDAAETLQNYINGEPIADETSTQTTTSTSTTTTTAATSTSTATTSTSTTTTTTRTITSPKRKKKPNSTWDEDGRSNKTTRKNDLTLGKALQQFGVQQTKVKKLYR